MSHSDHSSSHPAHDHGHGHDHAHHHAPANFGPAFAIGIALNSVFVAVELAIGFWVNSMALVADALHNLSDVFSLVLAWVGFWFLSRKPSGRFTYGFGRVSIQAALINVAILLVGVGAILFESIQRFAKPEPVEGGAMMIVAGIGILINGGTALLFMRGGSDVNIRGAFVHMAADAAVSLGVVVAGALVLLTSWDWIDPLVGVMIAGVILVSSWGLVRESVNLSLDAAPENVNVPGIREWFLQQAGVESLHDLHVWPLSTNKTALTAHLVIADGIDADALLKELAEEIEEHFAITHITIQLEKASQACPHGCEEGHR